MKFYLHLPVFAVFCILILLAGGRPAHTADNENSAVGLQYHDAYFLIDHLNTGLVAPPDTLNLMTPQATLEHFVVSEREDNHRKAAFALNLNLIPRHEQSRKAPELARKLFYVMNQMITIPWDDLPDRPDGQLNMVQRGRKQLAGKPRRSIELGSLDIDGRSLPVRIQRVKPKNADPVWVFSASTVENIPKMYEKYGPGFVDHYLPDWMKIRVFSTTFVWEWLYLLGIAMISALFGWLVQKITVFYIKRRPKKWSYGFADILPGPLSLLSGLLLFYILKLTTLSYTGPILNMLNPIILMLLFFALTWLGMRIIKFLSDYMSRRYVDGIHNYTHEHSRHLLTKINIGRQVLIFIALLIGIGFALSQISAFKGLGMSLLASAGVVSVIMGIAAQSFLGNLLGGIQIAVTQPASIGDSVLFEGNWGYVEKIAYTYIIIRTWDQRRVIVPLKYFLDHPFENWSKTDSTLVKPIYLYVDYRTDVQLLREKFFELLKNSEDADQDYEPLVQVTNLTEKTMEVWATCSAKDPGTAWTLHCMLREKMCAYVQELEDGRFLPKHRHRTDPIQLRDERPDDRNDPDDQESPSS